MKSTNRDMTEEAREEEAEASEPGKRDSDEPKGARKRGGAMKRKRGGMVHGKEAMARPDRRARGGGLSDTNPLTAAGNMSTPDYEKQSKVSNGGGAGGDKSPYGGGSHRRPG